MSRRLLPLAVLAALACDGAAGTGRDFPVAPGEEGKEDVFGRRLAGTPVTLLVDDLHIRVIHRHTGELIRELTLDPSRDFQPRGLPPGPPKTTP